jgi:phosphohistidine phosphatase
VDLILWRHADAAPLGEDGDDHSRPLTPKGERQAARMAAWLDRQLSQNTRILCSPARRAEQTVLALNRKFKFRDELSPNSNAHSVLELVKWHDLSQELPKAPTLVVGHQPWIGEVVSQLLKLPMHEMAFKKGAIWWLHCREREGQRQIVLLAVLGPERLSGLP